MDAFSGSLFPSDRAAAFPEDVSAVSDRPLCEAGIASPGSTSLKWGADGELTALDLHHVMARLLACDGEAMRMIDGEEAS